MKINSKNCEKYKLTHNLNKDYVLKELAKFDKFISVNEVQKFNSYNLVGKSLPQKNIFGDGDEIIIVLSPFLTKNSVSIRSLEKIETVGDIISDFWESKVIETFLENNPKFKHISNKIFAKIFKGYFPEIIRKNYGEQLDYLVDELLTKFDISDFLERFIILSEKIFVEILYSTNDKIFFDTFKILTFDYFSIVLYNYFNKSFENIDEFLEILKSLFFVENKEGINYFFPTEYEVFRIN